MECPNIVDPCPVIDVIEGVPSADEVVPEKPSIADDNVDFAAIVDAIQDMSTEVVRLRRTLEPIISSVISVDYDGKEESS